VTIDDVFLGLYSCGDVWTPFLNSLHSEFRQAFGQPPLLPLFISGYSVLEANRLMAEWFLDSRKPLLFHCDTDTELRPGTLQAMIQALEQGADVVTVHSPNRKGTKYRGMFQRGDNHKQDSNGKLIYFAQAVMLANRRVYELLPAPWYMPNVEIRGVGSDETGEIYFAHSVLSHPDLMHVSLDDSAMTARQWEVARLIRSHLIQEPEEQPRVWGSHLFRTYDETGQGLTEYRWPA